MHSGEERLYLDYVAGRERWLGQIAYRLCGNRHQAEDLVQQVLVDLYAHWSKATRATTLDAYVRRMVVHAWLRETRRPWFRRVRTYPELIDGAHTGPDVGLRLDLMGALAQLTPRQRAVLVLRFWDGLPIAETAAVLRCSEGTVKSQTSRSLAALRRLLPDYAQPEPALMPGEPTQEGS
ncbi:MAG TPA: SigE family RNA polymerase sigma factor [Mycobacteriales bacterium]|nr:SigE family RNA polymerase sigma factor [Mycobacteriales bacterium]